MDPIAPHERRDAALSWFLRLLALAGSSLSCLIVVFLLIEALPALRHVGVTRFFTDASWHPTSALFNLSPMLWGTLALTAGALVLAVPLGLGSGLFVHFYAPRRLAALHRAVVEVLAGIPSVVYGFWGLVVLVPFIAKVSPPGTSLLAGILILALMIAPTVAIITDASIASVPTEVLKAAVALGMTRTGTLRAVVLPQARRGIATGIVLATGRALGETMAVLMVCGNVVQTPESIFEPVRALTANMALEMAYATGDHRSALFVSGLVLMLVVSVLVLAADAISPGRNANA